MGGLKVSSCLFLYCPDHRNADFSPSLKVARFKKVLLQKKMYLSFNLRITSLFQSGFISWAAFKYFIYIDSLFVIWNHYNQFYLFVQGAMDSCIFMCFFAFWRTGITVFQSKLPLVISINGHINGFHLFPDFCGHFTSPSHSMTFYFPIIVFCKFVNWLFFAIDYFFGDVTRVAFSFSIFPLSLLMVTVFSLPLVLIISIAHFGFQPFLRLPAAHSYNQQGCSMIMFFHVLLIF